MEIRLIFLNFAFWFSARVRFGIRGRPRGRTPAKDVDRNDKKHLKLV